jgi:hypothetical protein
MRIRDVILPEDRVFFDFFDRMVETIGEASGLLVRLSGSHTGRPELCRQIRALEHSGDEVTRSIFERLNQSLITPLEPEEIARLAPALDDVLDRIDRVAAQICNYGIAEPNEELGDFATLISLASEEIGAGMAGLRNMEDLDAIEERSREINRLYNKGSDLLSRAVLRLFQSHDPVLIIKHKDIFESMQGVLERCNDLGHVLNDITRGHR